MHSDIRFETGNTGHNLGLKGLTASMDEGKVIKPKGFSHKTSISKGFKQRENPNTKKRTFSQSTK